MQAAFKLSESKLRQSETPKLGSESIRSLLNQSESVLVGPSHCRGGQLQARVGARSVEGLGINVGKGWLLLLHSYSGEAASANWALLILLMK